MNNEMQPVKLSWKNFFLGQVPAEYRDRYLQTRMETNLVRTFGLSIYIVVVQVALNLINILKPGDSKGEDIMQYVYLSLFTLCLGFVYLLISILVRRKKITNQRICRALPHSLLYIYVVIQLVFLSFNIQMEAGMNCYIIAVLLLSFFIIMPPIQSVLSIAATAASAVLMMYFSRAENDAWDTAIMTDSWANLLIITVLCGYMSVVMYRMYVKNFLSSVQLEESNAMLHMAAQTDALTGVYNRRGFFDRLDENRAAMEQSGKYITTVMIDVDFFKDYNDRNGHLEGDACLFKIAQVLKKSFDEVGGVVCRYGGEEFLALFGVDSPEEAFAIADRFRLEVEARNMTGLIQEGQTARPITVSCGLACVATHTDISGEGLIKLADDAVYKAKAQGRNCVVVA